jgi:hypothetical protein
MIQTVLNGLLIADENCWLFLIKCNQNYYFIINTLQFHSSVFNEPVRCNFCTYCLVYHSSMLFAYVACLQITLCSLSHPRLPHTLLIISSHELSPSKASRCAESNAVTSTLEGLYLRSLSNSDIDKFFISLVLGSVRLSVLGWKTTSIHSHHFAVPKNTAFGHRVMIRTYWICIKRLIYSENISVDKLWFFCVLSMTRIRAHYRCVTFCRSGYTVHKVVGKLILQDVRSTRNHKCATRICSFYRLQVIEIDRKFSQIISRCSYN